MSLISSFDFSHTGTWLTYTGLFFGARDWTAAPEPRAAKRPTTTVGVSFMIDYFAMMIVV